MNVGMWILVVYMVLLLIIAFYAAKRDKKILRISQPVAVLEFFF